MSQLACAATCHIPRRHVEDCDDPDCRGCLPGVAADGLLVCQYHTGLIPELALNAAKLYPLLAGMLLPTRSPGERTSGSKKGAPTPDDRVMAARTDIHVTLVALARRIADQRGVRPPLRYRTVRLPPGVQGPPSRQRTPTGNRLALAGFIGRHAEWLAAQPDAGQIVDRLVGLGWIGGPTWRLAYPKTPERLYVGECPLLLEDDSECGGKLFQVPDAPLITCAGCGTADTIEQWERWLYPDAESAVVDAYAGARALSRTWFRPVDPSLIRKWQQRGKVLPVQDGEQVVRDERGRTLYRLAELRAAATKAWGEAPKVRGRAA